MKSALCAVLLFGLCGSMVAQRADDRKPTDDRRTAKEAYLGVVVEKVPPMLRSQMPDLLPDGQGIMVMSVAKDSPAAKAGLMNHDVLLTFGEQKLNSPEQLVKLVRGQSPGQTVSLNYVRGGKQASIKVTLGENTQAPMGQENPNIFRFFPDDHFQMLFEENELRNGDKSWTSFDAMKLTRTDSNKWNAEIEYRNKEGKKETKKFSGTRQEIRKQIQEEKDLPDSEKHHLLRAMNLHPPVFEFHFPPAGSAIPESGQRP